jgi:hypothetical protein
MNSELNDRSSAEGWHKENSWNHYSYVILNLKLLLSTFRRWFLFQPTVIFELLLNNFKIILIFKHFLISIFSNLSLWNNDQGKAYPLSETKTFDLLLHECNLHLNNRPCTKGLYWENTWNHCGYTDFKS